MPAVISYEALFGAGMVLWMIGCVTALYAAGWVLIRVARWVLGRV